MWKPLVEQKKIELLLNQEKRFDEYLMRLESLVDQSIAEKKLKKMTKMRLIQFLEELLIVSTEILPSYKSKKMYKKIARISKDLLDLDFLTMFLLSGNNICTNNKISIGIPESIEYAFDINDGEGMPALVIKNKKSVTSYDLKNETRFFIPPLLIQKKITSAICVPMMFGKDVLGVLIGLTILRRNFSKDEISLFQYMGNQIATVIHHSSNLLDLSELKEQHMDILKDVSDIIQIVNQKGQIIHVNQKWFEVLKYTKREMKKLNYLDIIKKDHQLYYNDFLNKLQNGENISNLETIFITKDGKEVPVRGNLNAFFRDGRFIISRGIFKDISDYKRAEDTNIFLTNIAENSHDAIISLDLDGAIKTWNKGAEEILGYKKDEIIGKNFGYIVPDKGKRTCVYLLDDVCEKGYLKGIEAEYVAKDGRRVPVEITLSPLNDFMDNQIGFTFMMRDFSERKELERELYGRQEKLIEIAYKLELKNRELDSLNRMKGLFCDIMHHDLLNPIGIVATTAQMELEENPKNQNCQGCLRSMNRAVEIIENAILLSRLESSTELKKEDLCLREIINKVASDLKKLFNSSGLELVNNILDSMPIKANPIIEHVFINILTNALKYAPEGKKIVILGEEGNDFWRIKVIDFGEGIKDEYKNGIFERFSRKDKKGVKGSGLGLAIVKRIIELHNGKIWVEDNLVEYSENMDQRPNTIQGAIFIIELPIRSP